MSPFDFLGKALSKAPPPEPAAAAAVESGSPMAKLLSEALRLEEAGRTSALAQYAIYFFAAWGALSLLTYLVPMIWANVRGQQNMRLKYKADWALVTGASSGIGKAIAEALATQGLNVVLVALQDELLMKTFQELRAKFPECEVRVVGCDLTLSDGSYVDAIAKATADIHVSLLFNNAGFIVTGAMRSNLRLLPQPCSSLTTCSIPARAGFFHDCPIGKHMANVQCNSIAGVRITHHFLPLMYKSKRPGLICFTSSAAAYIPSPFTALYSATKSFISRFATSLAAEAGPQGIDVVAVHPSPVRSNFLQGTAKFDMIDNFYKLSTGPVRACRSPPCLSLAALSRLKPLTLFLPSHLQEAVPPMIFRKVGRGQVLADLGFVGLAMRLVTKLLDDNFFAAAFAMFACYMPDYKKLAKGVFR